MATWSTPKTNWTADDYVNNARMTTLAGSLIYLHDTLVSKGADIPALADLEALRQLNYDGFMTASQFSSVELMLYRCSEAVNRLYGLYRPFPSYETYRENDPSPDYERLNEIGSAMIKIYNCISDKYILPYYLQSIEYIEQRDGKAYIDTGLTPTDDSQMDLRFYTTCTSNFYCAGTMDDYGKVVFAQDGVASGSLVSATVNSSRAIATSQGGRWTRTSSGQTYDISLAASSGMFRYAITDIDKSISFSANKTYGSVGEVHKPICIFALNSKAIVSGVNRLYSFEYRSKGELLTHFVPCRDTRTGEVGVFDLVGNRFYGNRGLGAFIAGPDVR
jgi:hypothetical protein